MAPVSLTPEQYLRYIDSMNNAKTREEAEAIHFSLGLKLGETPTVIRNPAPAPAPAPVSASTPVTLYAADGRSVDAWGIDQQNAAMQVGFKYASKADIPAPVVQPVPAPAPATQTPTVIQTPAPAPITPATQTPTVIQTPAPAPIAPATQTPVTQAEMERVAKNTVANDPAPVPTPNTPTVISNTGNQNTGNFDSVNLTSEQYLRYIDSMNNAKTREEAEAIHSSWGYKLGETPTVIRNPASAPAPNTPATTTPNTGNFDFDGWGNKLKDSILEGVDAKNKEFGTKATSGFMDAFKNFSIPASQQNGVNMGNYNDNRNASADQWWSSYVTGRR